MVANDDKYMTSAAETVYTSNQDRNVVKVAREREDFLSEQSELRKSGEGSKILPVSDVCASFQETVSSTLLKKLKSALEKSGYKQVVIAGGVAANSEIRKKIFNLENEGYKVFAPPMKYCTDNAAMVASCAYFNTNTFDDVNTEVFSRVK